MSKAPNTKVSALTHTPRMKRSKGTSKTTSKTKGTPKVEAPFIEPDLSALPADLSELLTMLTYVRPHGSVGEAQFVDRYVMSLPGAYVKTDRFGEVAAYVVEVMDPDTGLYPPHLFTAHVDTVHSDLDGVRQPVDYDTNLDLVLTVKDQPLGADDGAGVWLMRQMIAAGVPGVYCFPRGEERGGIGSSALSDDHGEWLAQFSFAVAFDRRGNEDVITHQSCGRCCSDTFAGALARALGGNYAPDDGGIFTDTANFIEHVAECTNLSCGYNHEHSKDEYLDVAHILWLRDALLKVDWAALPVVREPAPPDYGLWGGYGDALVKGFHTAMEGEEIAPHDLFGMALDDMQDLAYERPEAFAEAVFLLLNGGQ